MTGNWTIELEGGRHSVHASFSLVTGDLTVSWDNVSLISKKLAGIPIGQDIYSFSRNEHAFVLRFKTPALWYHLELFMDGIALPSDDAPPVPRNALTPRFEFVQEQNVSETEEIVAIDDFPLDNSFGTDALTTERQISKELTNELTLQDANQISGTLGLEALHALKAEVAAQVSRQTGSKVGEKVTESQAVRFTVGANRSVVYQVIWKRKVRKGEQIYLAAGERVIIPYCLNYGISCQVRTLQPKNATA